MSHFYTVIRDFLVVGLLLVLVSGQFFIVQKVVENEEFRAADATLTLTILLQAFGG